MTFFIVDMLVRVTLAACGGGFDHYPLNCTQSSVFVIVKRVGRGLGSISCAAALHQEMFVCISLMVDFSERPEETVKIVVIENV